MSKLLMLRSTVWLSGFFLIVAETNPASAYSLFTSRSAWNTEITNQGLSIDFVEDFSTGATNSDSITFANSGIESDASPTLSNRTRNQVSNGVYTGIVAASIANNSTFESITWNFPQPIRAWGADFISAASAQILEVRGSFDGAGEQIINFGDAGVNSGFLGVIGNADFGSITFFTTNTGGRPINGSEGFQVDNFVGAVSQPVPEPLTILGSLVGLSFGLIMEKKHRQSQQD